MALTKAQTIEALTNGAVMVGVYANSVKYRLVHSTNEVLNGEYVNYRAARTLIDSGTVVETDIPSATFTKFIGDACMLKGE